MVPYRTLSSPLIRLGYAALPSRGDGSKSPAVAFGHLTSASSAEALVEMRGWDGPPDGALWLLDALAGSGAPDLDVLDYDDLADVPWGVQHFGESPLTQTTGRVGGGVHHIYRRDPSRPRDERGSKPGFIRGRAIDLKSWHGYIVAPGSLHRSGLRYRLQWHGQPLDPSDLTLEMLYSLPILSRELIEQAEGAAVEEETYIELGLDKKASPLRLRSGAQGRFPRSTADVEAIIPAGAWHGLSIEAVARRLGQGETGIACPHAADGRVHATDLRGGETARLHVDGGKPAFTVCFACSTTYTYRWMGQHFPSDTEKRSAGPSRVSLSEGDLTDGYLDDLRLAQALRRAGVRRSAVMVLQLGQARGKTELAARLVRAASRRGARVIGVTPTRSLSREQGRRLGLPCYLDMASEGPIEGSASICLPSLRRAPAYRMALDALSVEDVGADLLVLDEVEQQLRTLLGSHLSDAQARDAYSALLSHVRRADAVLLLDADAGPLTEALLSAAGRLEEAVWVTGPPAAPRDAVVWASRAEWLADLMAHAGQGHRVAVAVHSVEEAQVLARLLPQHSGGETACITGETVGAYDLAALEQTLLERGHLVYTPVLGTGVSIALRDHFSRVYALLSDAVGTGADALQLVSRVRHPTDRTLRVGRIGGGRTPAPWERDPAQVLRTWAAREAQTMRKIGFVRDIPADIATYEDGTPALRPDVVAYVRMCASAHAADVCDGEGRVLQALCDRLKVAGGRVFDLSAPEQASAYAQLCSQMRAGLKDLISAERVDAIVSADLPPAEAIAQMKKRGAQTKKQIDTLRKAGIEAFYGEGSGSDHDTVAWDDRGRGRTRARSLAHLVAVLEGGIALESLKKQDRDELVAGVGSPRLRHRVVRSQALTALLRRLGVEGGVRQAVGLDGGESPNLTLSAERAAEVAAWALTPPGAQVMRLMGLTVRRDAAEKPLQLAGTILRACGLTLSAERLRSGAARGTRVYTVTGIAETLEKAAFYLKKLRQGLAVSDDLFWVEPEPELEQLGCLSPEQAEALLADVCAA